MEEDKAPAAPPSPYATRGTVMAFVAEQCLKHELDPTDYIGKSVRGETINAEDIEPLKIFLDHVKGLGGSDAVKIPEARLDLTEFWPGLYGTADAIVVDPPALYVSDLKWGEGVYVSAFDNPQLMIYGLGALLRYGNHGTNPIEHLHLSIVQPRWTTGEVVRTQTMPAHMLLEWGVRKLLPALRATEENIPAYKPGDHCRFCAARGTCPALKDFALEQVRQDFAKADTLTGDEIAVILDRASVVESWIEAVREEAMRRAQKGDVIPGWILATGRHSRRWRAPDNETALHLFSLGLKEEDIWETKMRSPAQVEKRLPKSKRDDINVLVDIVAGGAKLVKDDGRVPLPGHIELDFTPAFLA